MLVQITQDKGEKRIISAWAGGQNRGPIRSNIECIAHGARWVNYDYLHEDATGGVVEGRMPSS